MRPLVPTDVLGDRGHCSGCRGGDRGSGARGVRDMHGGVVFGKSCCLSGGIVDVCRVQDMVFTLRWY